MAEGVRKNQQTSDLADLRPHSDVAAPFFCSYLVVLQLSIIVGAMLCVMYVCCFDCLRHSTVGKCRSDERELILRLQYSTLLHCLSSSVGCYAKANLKIVTTKIHSKTQLGEKSTVIEANTLLRGNGALV